MPGETDFGPNADSPAVFEDRKGMIRVRDKDGKTIRDANGNTLYTFENTADKSTTNLGTLPELQALMEKGTLKIPSYVPGVGAAGRRRRKSHRRKSHRRKSRRSRK